MLLRLIPGQYAFVAKVDVLNLAASLKWYEEKLGLINDPRFQTETWAQLNMPGIPRVAVGLNLGKSPVSSGGAVSTFVVRNIKEARDLLIKEGVQVSPIQDVGKGVQLAFFKDPDGNSLGLRQNSPEEPTADAIGTF